MQEGKKENLNQIPQELERPMNTTLERKKKNPPENAYFLNKPSKNSQFQKIKRGNEIQFKMGLERNENPDFRRLINHQGSVSRAF